MAQQVPNDVHDDTRPRVVAVVVTFERPALLRRLLERITSVAGLDEIVVVDNASRDGTPGVLTEFAAAPVPVVAERMAVNSGGAGGFHHGMAVARDRGAELLWLMDDDAVPEKDCLELLLAAVDEQGLAFAGPAVVDEDDPDTLCFPIRVPGTSRALHRVAELGSAAVDGVVRDIVIPFNGVVVTRELVERIGLPDAEYFIWGDDVEYLWRARRADAKVGTVADARVLHPSTDDLGTRMMFGLTTYNHSPSELKHYCMVRNNVVNLRTYFGLAHVAAFVVKTFWFYLLTRPDRHRVALSVDAMRAGWRRDFSGHRRFLAGAA